MANEKEEKIYGMIIYIVLEIRVLKNFAKLGGGCTAGRNFGGVSICV